LIGVSVKPIKKIIIYDLRKRTEKDFQYQFSGQTIPWCNGYMISSKEIEDPVLYGKALIESQTIHIAELNYCALTKFPEEAWKNDFGGKIKFANASHIDYYKYIAEFLKEHDRP